MRHEDEIYWEQVARLAMLSRFIRVEACLNETEAKSCTDVKFCFFRVIQEVGDIAPWISKYDSAASCIAALISYLNLMDNDDNFGQFTVEKFDLTRYMRLDSAAVSALNMFSPVKTSAVQQSRATDSLFAVLNRCQTHQVGRRQLTLFASIKFVR